MKNFENKQMKSEHTTSNALKINYTPQSSTIVFFLALFLPSIVVTIFNVIVGDIYQNSLTYYIALTLMQLTFVAIYIAYNKIGKYNPKKASKLNFNLNYKQILIIIVIGIIGLFSFSPLVNLYQGILQIFGHTASFDNLNLSDVGYLFLNILIVGLFPAVCEELIFRGVILNGCSKYKKWVMVVVSSLLFMIMHLSIDQTIYQLFLGVLLSLVVITTGSIVSSMILHAVNNFVILFTNYLYNIMGVDTNVPYEFTVWNCIYPILIAIAGVIICVLLVKLLGKVTKNKVSAKNEIIDTKSQLENKESKNEKLANSNNKNEQIANSYILKGLTQSSSELFWLLLGVGGGIIYWVIMIII